MLVISMQLLHTQDFIIAEESREELLCLVFAHHEERPSRLMGPPALPLRHHNRYCYQVRREGSWPWMREYH